MALLLAPLRWLTSSIIRVAMFAGILVAVYFLLLKPAIDGGERKVTRGLHTLERTADPKHLAHCLQKAEGDLDKMKRCARVF